MFAKRAAAFGMAPESLATRPKGQRGKQLTAWCACERTTVTRRCVAGRLKTGHESRVPQALRSVRGGRSDGTTGMTAE